MGKVNDCGGESDGGGGGGGGLVLSALKCLCVPYLALLF